MMERYDFDGALKDLFEQDLPTLLKSLSGGKRVKAFEGMSNLPAPLRAKLDAEFVFDDLKPVRTLGSEDTTRKFLFALGDGALIEAVLIPASPALYGEASDRRTLCVSTQVGCAYGCKFCASGWCRARQSSAWRRSW